MYAMLDSFSPSFPDLHSLVKFSILITYKIGDLYHIGKNLLHQPENFLAILCLPYSCFECLHTLCFCRITDAYNNARDRVRYLENLSPHLELLETSPPPNPSNITSSTLPALASAFKQMDGLSRVYARSGYLGILLTKV